MSKLTTERLEELANATTPSVKYVGREIIAMARQLLAYRNKFTGQFFTLEQQPDATTDAVVYEPAPAQPVIPEHRQRISDDDLVAVPRSVLACAGYAYGKAGLKDGNAYAQLRTYFFAPAITAQPVSEPDGWKLVPIEPTENMIIDGFESEPDKTFSKPEVWEEYAAMSGCKQAAHRAKLCWAAMLAAAPTAQEQK